MPTLYRGVNQVAVPSEAEFRNRLISWRFAGERAPGTPGQRTAILAAGLPYHRRRGLRKLDSLLMVRGETARRFRLGIAIDVRRSDGSGLGFCRPVADHGYMEQGAGSHPEGTRGEQDVRLPTSSAWLFHLDSRAVVSTHWAPIIEGSAVAGFRVRLLETQGRHAPLVLRSFRTVQSAQKAGGGDRPPVDLTVEGDRITIPLRPYEWADVKANFLSPTSR